MAKKFAVLVPGRWRRWPKAPVQRLEQHWARRRAQAGRACPSRRPGTVWDRFSRCRRWDWCRHSSSRTWSCNLSGPRPHWLNRGQEGHLQGPELSTFFAITECPSNYHWQFFMYVSTATWPNFVKNCYLFSTYLAKILILRWQKYYSMGHFMIVVNGQIF